MKKIIITLFLVMLGVIIFFTRTGITFQLQLLSERMYFGCYSITAKDVTGCMNKYYHDLTKEAGAMTAIQDMKEGYGKYPTLRNACHGFIHVVGRAAAEGDESLATLFGQGDPFCWSGYYHGVVEGKLRGTPIARMTPEFVNNFCADIPKTEANYFNYYNCVHGSGHAFMYVSRNNLPVALNRCAMLIADDDKQNCAGGAFMENILASQTDHSTKFIRADEPYFPCTILEDTPFMPTCYSVQATLFLKDKSQPEKAFQLCEKVPDANSRNSCMEGLGREIAAGSFNTTKGTLAGCMMAPSSDALNTCIVGAMKNFISFYHDDILAKELCASLDPATQMTCDGERSKFIRLFASTTTSIIK